MGIIEIRGGKKNSKGKLNFGGKNLEETLEMS